MWCGHKLLRREIHKRRQKITIDVAFKFLKKLAGKQEVERVPQARSAIKGIVSIDLMIIYSNMITIMAQGQRGMRLVNTELS